MRLSRTITISTVALGVVATIILAATKAVTASGETPLPPLPASVDSSQILASDAECAIVWDFAPDGDRRFNDDMDYKGTYMLRRYVSGRQTDSAALVCPNPRLSGNKDLCYIINGVDTLSLDCRRPLPAVIDCRSHEVIPGCRDYRLSRHFQDSGENPYPTDFQLNISLPADTPPFILDSISCMIRRDVAGYFGDYSGDKTVYPDIKLFKATASNVDKMMEYYYDQFCKLCRKYGYDRYSYQLYVYPVWEDRARHLMTWKFYTYGYMGGAHGGDTECYLTFDTRDGRLLGIRDFYTDAQIPGVYEKLAALLNAYHGRTPLDDYYEPACLDPESGVTSAADTTLNELYDGQIYPRPARTRQGIVFTYQTYEKGSNADGTLHFLIR